MANDLTQQFAGSFQRMPAGRRITLLAAVALVVAAVVGVGMWASEPAWVVLYQDVSLGEAGRMIDVLDKAGVTNKLGADGSNVMVARQDHARARVLLGKAQLPTSGRPGFELFDNTQAWGMTEFTQRITYQRALEGELSRTISATDGVERAEVHLTIPESGALRRGDRPAKAAVVVKMRPGMTLAAGAVQGIIATISNSVDRLAPANIAVTDDTGRLLSSGGDEGTTLGGASRYMEIQRSVEAHLAAKAERLLSSVSGLGAPRVQVSAQLNFDQVERTIESFDPDAQVIQRESRSEADASPEGGGGQTIVNNEYQNSRKLEKILTGGGAVTRLTVAVLVDERSLNADSTASTPIPTRLANVEGLVKNAIGFDSTRGDRIAVSAVPFEIVPIDTTRAIAPASDPIGTIERFIRPAIGLVAIVALLIVALKAVSALKPGLVAAAADGGRSAAFAPQSEAMIPPLGPPPENVLLKNRVMEESGGKPEMMAQVVRAWMSEGSA